MLALPSAAHADGDPASDILVSSDVYVPGGTTATALERAVATVYARRLRIKVAVIATEADLGAVPELFNKPGQYARFLGSELSTFYVGPLLIVMPTGFGIYDGGRSTAAEQRVIGAHDVHGSSADDLVRTATSVVQALLAAHALASKDIRAPQVFPSPASAHRGATATLRYFVLEDSRWSKERITITAHGKKVATLRKRLHSASYTKSVAVAWRVPKSLGRGAARYCVRPTDVAGNRGVASCAQLTIR